MCIIYIDTKNNTEKRYFVNSQHMKMNESVFRCSNVFFFFASLNRYIPIVCIF